MSVVFESYSFSQVNKLEFAQAVEIKGFMKAVRKPGCGPEISFSEFVKVVCGQESIDQERHWRRQSDEIFSTSYLVGLLLEDLSA